MLFELILSSVLISAAALADRDESSHLRAKRTLTKDAEEALYHRIATRVLHHGEPLQFNHQHGPVPVPVLPKKPSYRNRKLNYHEHRDFNLHIGLPIYQLHIQLGAQTPKPSIEVKAPSSYYLHFPPLHSNTPRPLSAAINSAPHPLSAPKSSAHCPYLSVLFRTEPAQPTTTNPPQIYRLSTTLNRQTTSATFSKLTGPIHGLFLPTRRPNGNNLYQVKDFTSPEHVAAALETSTQQHRLRTLEERKEATVFQSPIHHQTKEPTTGLLFELAIPTLQPVPHFTTTSQTEKEKEIFHEKTVKQEEENAAHEGRRDPSKIGPIPTPVTLASTTISELSSTTDHNEDAPSTEPVRDHDISTIEPAFQEERNSDIAIQDAERDEGTGGQITEEDNAERSTDKPNHSLTQDEMEAITEQDTADAMADLETTDRFEQNLLLTTMPAIQERVLDEELTSSEKINEPETATQIFELQTESDTQEKRDFETVAPKDEQDAVTELTQVSAPENIADEAEWVAATTEQDQLEPNDTEGPLFQGEDWIPAVTEQDIIELRDLKTDSSFLQENGFELGFEATTISPNPTREKLTTDITQAQDDPPAADSIANENWAAATTEQNNLEQREKEVSFSQEGNGFEITAVLPNDPSLEELTTELSQAQADSLTADSIIEQLRALVGPSAIDLVSETVTEKLNEPAEREQLLADSPDTNESQGRDFGGRGSREWNLHQENQAQSENTLNNTKAKEATSLFSGPSTEANARSTARRSDVMVEEDQGQDALGSIIPIVIQDLRAGIVSESDQEVLREIFGNRWPSIEEMARSGAIESGNPMQVGGFRWRRSPQFHYDDALNDYLEKEEVVEDYAYEDDAEYKEKADVSELLRVAQAHLDWRTHKIQHG